MSRRNVEILKIIGADVIPEFGGKIEEFAELRFFVGASQLRD